MQTTLVGVTKAQIPTVGGDAVEEPASKKKEAAAGMLRFQQSSAGQLRGLVRFFIFFRLLLLQLYID